MKKILYHFRTSLVLGALLLGSYGYRPHLPTISKYPQVSQSGQVESLTSRTEGDNEVKPSPNPEPDPPKVPTDSYEFNSDIIIKAINPGYTINDTRDVGELIELQKTIDNPSLSLAGYGIRYTNSSGNSTLLLDFSEGSFMTGETLLMRLARSPGSDRADATYMTTLAMSSGKIELLHFTEVVDTVCWGSQTDCLPSFKSTKPTTLLRNLETGNFEHIEEYEPDFDPASPSLILPSIPDGPSDNPSDNSAEITAHCYDLEFSEVFAYYTAEKSEQFIELYNPSDNTVILDRCALRYKKKTYYLSGEIGADSYYAYYPAQQASSFSLTKNPNSSNTIELIDTNNAVVDSLVYNHGQKKSTSYARFYTSGSEEIWDLTYAPTPGATNTYQEFRSCPTGKTINPDTGNCVNITGSSSSAKTCPEGKYLNPLTGRCKKIDNDSNEPKPCAAGYERNPETNRCRKIKSDNTGADYALVPNTYSSKSVFIAAGAVILLTSIGTIYIILQFRREIARATRKAIQRVNHIRKDLVSRRIRLHRKQKP